MRQTLFLLPLIVCGCTSGGYVDRWDQIRTQNRESLNRLTVGITKEQALSIMGTETYEVEWGRRINNPYRTETIRTKDGEPVLLVFYYTDVKARDDAVTDDELTPLVFEDGSLVGWGWSYLDQNVQKYEYRVRLR
jgi:hypothetical protein